MSHESTIDRRSLIAVGAAAGTAVALGAGKALAVTDIGEDAELRRLWPQYLAQLRRHDAAWAAARRARDRFDAVHRDDYTPPYKNGELPGVVWDRLRPQRLAFGVDQSFDAACREHRKLIRITKAIRRAKAQSVFGIAVKLSATEHFEHEDLQEAVEDALRSIAALTGTDFLAATGGLHDDDERRAA